MLKSTNLLIFILITSFISGKAFAQNGSLSGKLVDEKGSAIGFANVTLLKSSDTAFLAGVLTNKEGTFSLRTPSPGMYVLRFSAIGFTETKTGVFEVNTPSFSKDFGQLTLKQETKTLQEVSVTALRPTITQLADRMVVSVEGTAMAAGSNAFTVLSKSPGVFIDQEGNIQLNGRAGVTVMINGKLTYLSARDLRTLLEGMSAENIKNIEVITNPSAKYDAEGSSGILNINLKKYDRSGMNGSLYSGYTYNGKQHGYTAGGNINYNSGPWTTYLNLDFAHRVGGREATFTRVFYGTNQTTYFDQTATGNFMAQGPPTARLGVDFNINANHSIGVMGYYNTNTARADFLTNTYIGSAPKQPAQYIDADNYTRNTYRNMTTNLHYQGKLDTLGTTLSSDLDYVKITNRGYSDYFNYFTDLSNNQQSTDFLYTSLPNGYDIYSGKIDFAHPFTKSHKMEAGVKASRVISDNDSRFYFNNNGLVLDPSRTNHFNYKENIYAAYLNYNGTLSKRFTLQAGLRAEQTKSTGISYTTKRVDKRDYLNLFPSVFIQQKVSDNYGINYSYSRRLSRPNYGNLNPFKAYRDPYTWYEGNPYLRPQYTNVFSLAQTFKKVYILTLSYQRTTDVMAEIPILDVDNSTTIYTTGNVNDGHSASMSAVAPLKITKKWDTQNTVLLSYNKFSMMSNNGQLENDQLFYMIQSNHTIQLPKAIRMELNLLYRGPAASGLYHMAAMHRVDVGFKRSFLNKKLDLSLNANDLFKGYRFFWTTDINGNVNEFDQYFRFRNVGFTIRYNFNKGKNINVKQRSNSVDEVNRI
jgi:outer membrane receptor protein involved in Fe transport